MSTHSEAPPPRKASTSEDWMQVLDNFLDNDESNHNGESNHQQQERIIVHPAHYEPATSNSSIPSAGSEDDKTTNNKQTVSSGSSGGGELLGASAHSTTSVPIDNLDSNTDLTEEMKTQIRSERKRTREKQRRSDVNSQFSTLTELLQRVEGYDLESDVSDDEDDTETKKRKINSVGVLNVAPSNRVDLIARTISVMDRLHRVNRALRQNVKGLRKQVKKFSLMSAGGDDLKKPGMMNMGSNFMNSQMQGMMMMMPQQMGAMGQNPGSGDSQQPMMMMVPMMMPNAMMQQQQQQQQNGAGFMPGMNMNPGMGMIGPQSTVPNQMQFQPNPSQGQQSQTAHQNQHCQHPQSSTTNQLNNVMNGTNNANIQNPNSMLNQMPFMNAPSAPPNNLPNHGTTNGQNQPINASQMGMQMTVFNPITNAWTTQQQPQQQQQPQHQLQQQGQPSVNGAAGQNVHQSQGQIRSSTSTNSEENGTGNDNGSFSYGGNLAHCA